ncbi:MAG: ribosome recycling factor [Nitrospirae bacterium]|nr:ribosome recycling factor [Nitrospirota bacterium]
MIIELKKKMTDKMEAALNVLKKEFATIRTGRASLSLLDGVKVDYYGNTTPLNQVATLAVPESRLITIQPWDPKVIEAIEKAILSSGLGITPANDGKVIRLPVPPLTEERRKELVKLAKKMAEDARVAIRNIRRDINEEVKKIEKEKKISEDESRKSLEDIQKTTDQYIKKIDDILKKKEEEIMEV